MLTHKFVAKSATAKYLKLFSSFVPYKACFLGALYPREILDCTSLYPEEGTIMFKNYNDLEVLYLTVPVRRVQKRPFCTFVPSL